MAQTVLELVIERARRLRNVHRTHGLVPYPVVRICDDDGDCYYDSENNISVDPNGGSNPVWNVLFECNMNIVEAQWNRLHLKLSVESRRRTPCAAPKCVGEVRVPIVELHDDFGDADVRKSVTRPVLNERGEERGSLTFSYKFGRTLGHPPAARPQPANGNPDAQIPQRNRDGNPIVSAVMMAP